MSVVCLFFVFVVCVVVYMMCTLFWYVAVLGGVCRRFVVCVGVLLLVVAVLVVMSVLFLI